MIFLVFVWMQIARRFLTKRHNSVPPAKSLVEIFPKPGLSGTVRDRLGASGIAPPAGRIFLAEDVAPAWARFARHDNYHSEKPNNWESKTLLLMPDEGHLAHSEWPDSWKTHTVSGAVAYANLAVNAKERAVILLELQNEFNARDYPHMRKGYPGYGAQAHAGRELWERWKAKGGLSGKYENWHAGLMLAAAEFARKKGYSFYVTTPAHHLNLWTRGYGDDLSEKTAGKVYGYTLNRLLRKKALNATALNVPRERLVLKGGEFNEPPLFDYFDFNLRRKGLFGLKKIVFKK